MSPPPVSAPPLIAGGGRRLRRRPDAIVTFYSPRRSMPAGRPLPTESRQSRSLPPSFSPAMDTRLSPRTLGSSSQEVTMGYRNFDYRK